ncbi:hypothetical protein MBANPS3_006100 [Mucor bainieri]
MNSQRPSATPSESYSRNQREGSAQSNQSTGSSSSEEPGQTDQTAERSPSRQLSDISSMSGGDREDSPQQEAEENETDERTCDVCHRSGLKGEKGLRIHQRNSRQCFRIMRNTQREQSVVSSSGGSREEDASSVAFTWSRESSIDRMDFMDNFVERILQLTPNRVNVVRVHVSQILEDILLYLSNEVFTRERYERAQNWLVPRLNWLVPRLKRGTIMVLRYLLILYALFLIGCFFHVVTETMRHKEDFVMLKHAVLKKIQ